MCVHCDVNAATAKIGDQQMTELEEKCLKSLDNCDQAILNTMKKLSEALEIFAEDDNSQYDLNSSDERDCLSEVLDANAELIDSCNNFMKSLGTAKALMSAQLDAIKESKPKLILETKPKIKHKNWDCNHENGCDE